ASETKLIVVETDGTTSVCDLARLVKQTEKSRGYLDFKMLLLPDGLGSVPGGMFHSAPQVDLAQRMDVADMRATAKRTLFLFNGEQGATRLANGDAGDTRVPASSIRADLVQYAADTY